VVIDVGVILHVIMELVNVTVDTLTAIGIIVVNVEVVVMNISGRDDVSIVAEIMQHVEILFAPAILDIIIVIMTGGMVANVMDAAQEICAL
jgi:hypothetical protein